MSCQRKPRPVRDFRRLKFCPRCPRGKSELYVATFRLRNWKAWQAWTARGRGRNVLGPDDPEPKLETDIYQVACPHCHYGTLYLADTGEECDRNGLRIGKRRAA